MPMVVTTVPRRTGDRRRVRRTVPVDLSALVELVPQIGEMLGRAGQLVRIVGSKDLLDGVRNGALQYMRADLGHMTAVLDEHGRIVGHVQLRPAQGAGVLTPAAAVFQIASAITLQYYLQRFDEQLAEIPSAVREDREHAAWAVVARAALEAAEIAEVLQRDGCLAPYLRARLEIEERAVDVVALEEIRPVEEAVVGLQAARDEIAVLLSGRGAGARVTRSANALRATLPGGLRQSLLRALDALGSAMTHWYIAARAAQVHAALCTLRAVDDQLAGRSGTGAGRSALLERASAQQALGTEVGELLALPAAAFELFTIDRPVTSRVERLRPVATSLVGESDSAAERLVLLADQQVDEMVLASRGGGVVALPSQTVAAG